MTARPPTQVQVGPYRYRVVVSEAAINKACVDAQDGRYGQHDPQSLTITLDPKMGGDMMASVLLHELEHACLFQVGAEEDLDKAQLERICNATGTMFLDILRRNPELVHYLTED